MNNKKTSNLFVRLALIFAFLLLFAKFVENNIFFPKFNERHAERIQNIFAEKEKTLLRYIDRLKKCTQITGCDSCYVKYHGKYNEKLKKHGLYLFVYRNDTLDYWSSKDVAVPELYSVSEFDKPYVSLGNDKWASGKYASFVNKDEGYKIVGLVLIKKVYVSENKYLKTAFQKDFGLPAKVKIFPAQVENSYPITDKDGTFAWSLIFDSSCFYDYQIYIPVVAYLLAIIVFFLLLDRVFRSSVSKNLYIIVLAFVLTTMRVAMQIWQIPDVFYQLELFSPIYFGSGWFPSLGELCLWCIFICFFVLEVYRFMVFPDSDKQKRKYYMYLTVMFVTVIIGFFAIRILLKELVINSSGVFERDPSATSFFNELGLLVYTIILLFLFSFFLLIKKTVQLCKFGMTFYKYSLKKDVKFRYSHYVLLVFVFALFSSVYINHYSYEKYENKKKLLVTNLLSQHDLTTEFLLKGISDRIILDSDSAYFNSQSLEYIKKEYFYSSYWNKYKFQLWTCNDTSQLKTGQPQRKQNCIDIFKEQTEKMGTKLARSEFYYIDRPNDISWYLGWFRVSKKEELPLHLFIELWPNEASNELGYPELLLDERSVAGNNLKGYSYATYRNNKRMLQSGSYQYNPVGDIFQTDKSEYHTVYADGTEHLVYRPDANNMIVLSSVSQKLSDYLVNFSFIFIFSLTIVSFCLLIINFQAIKREFRWNFRNKIQYSMIAIVLISFAIIIFFTVYYVNRQYMSKNIDIVNEKMRTIHAELLDEIPVVENIEEDDKDILAGWLSYFQRIFFTDINLFNANGQLIATSSPDIFDMGLAGRQIDPGAYIKLVKEKRASIIEQEDIGGLHYLSAYEIFTDSENNIIALLNLRYFTHQGALTEEISSVIMALLNTYMVITLLTVLISVMMSNQITKPLMMLQDKFRNIKLGAKNEPVLYNSRDELGGLVKEYNRAIEELARSANRLARSERESAWREMAKQIAHEINNPLTPMKLSVQHLKRAYDNKSERFEQYMERISNSLVEQIDNLSAIATEFSIFAKMPAANNERIDLLDQINAVVPLFAIDDNKHAFHINFNGLEHAMIFADKEHISRVFINLFKNALQAIPKNRQAEIHIDVLQINHIIWVRVKDNGMGIPEEMREKMFRPNFTTKSGGMGVGLSIVRNIIESAGGTINFKTATGEGTKFIMSLPLSEG